MPKTALSTAEQADGQLPAEKMTTATSKPVSARTSSTDVKPMKASQTIIVANCPYCNQKHDLPIEKGRNGKPFFVSCAKCTTEFAVRFVPVTMYQAQVAAFR